MASESKVTGVSGNGDEKSCQEVDESQGGCEEDCEEEVKRFFTVYRSAA
jgi:hypothetical protein